MRFTTFIQRDSNWRLVLTNSEVLITRALIIERSIQAVGDFSIELLSFVFNIQE